MIKSLMVLMITMNIILLASPVYALAPLEKVDISNPRLVNAFGVPLSEHVNVNQQIQISADITNNQQKFQDFVYIVQITDENGLIVSLGWISGALSANQNLNPALSWTPKTSGTFSAEIFVWDSLINQEALDEFKTIEIVVS